MEKDENADAEQHEIETGTDTNAEDTKGDTGSEGGEQKEDYRGKLNITNRFLEKEGYEFKEGKWQKKAAAAKPQQTASTSTPAAAEFTPDDLAFLYAKVHEEDVDEVKKLATAYGVSLKEALKTDTIKTILAKREEHRKTANATNTKAARPSTKEVTDDEVLAEASKGNIPEKGSPEAQKLFWAKRGGKRS